jgi:two-component sensor histidine kinase/tetratricopeptide (TPR) repeat protein
MQLYVLLLAFLLTAAVAHAQTQTDSLRSALSRQQGDQRYATLRQLCHIYTRPSLSEEEMAGYANELIAMASARKDTAALVEGYISLVMKEKRTPENTPGKYILRAKALAQHHPELLAEVLFWESEIYFSIGMEDKAMTAIQKGLALYDKHRLPADYRIKLLGGGARIYSTHNDIHITDSLLNTMLGYAQTPADSMEALRFVAICRENSGQMDKALDAYLNSYRIAHRIHNVIFAVNNLRQAASILRDQKRYDKALQYYEEAAAIAQQHKLTMHLGSIYHSLGILHKNSGNFKEAIRYGQLALDIKHDLGRPKKILTTACMIAESYREVGEYEALKTICAEYMPLSESVNMYEVTSKMGYLAAIAYAKTGRPGDGRQWLEVANNATPKVNNLEELMPIFGMAADAHAALGLFESAFLYEQRHQAVKDTLFDMEKNRLVLEMEAAFETEKQTERIKDLDRENALSKAQLAAGRARQQGLLIGLLSLGLLAVALYRNAISRKRHNALLEQTNTELYRKNHEVQTLLREIHHRVKNNLQIVSSLLRLQARKTDDAGALDALRTSQARVRAMALLHQRLYQENNLVGIPMQAYMEELSRSLFDTYRVDEDRIQLHTELDEVTLDVDSAVPIGLITNELITNALKHAFPGNRRGVIQILLKTENKSLRLEITDNGVGAPMHNGKPAGSDASFGLELVESLAEKLQATLHFSNLQGSRITLLAPISSLTFAA